MTSLFHGSALCEVDPEGNVPIPQFLAEALEKDARSAELLIAPHEADTCLVGFGRGHLDALHDGTQRRRRADEAAGGDARDHHRRVRRTFGLVERAPRGGDCMRIPPAMRHLGRIGGLALFVGTGDAFEIWNPDLAMANGDEQFRDLAAFRVKAGAAGATSMERH